MYIKDFEKQLNTYIKENTDGRYSVFIGSVGIKGKDNPAFYTSRYRLEVILDRSIVASLSFTSLHDEMDELLSFVKSCINV